MKNIILLCFLFVFGFKSFSQELFEGVITFTTEISTPKNAKDDMLNKLKYKFGDSLKMYYSKEGNFKRKYLNTGDSGLDSQTYIAEDGILVIKKKGTSSVQTTDVSINTLRPVSFKEIDNQYIMNLDCNCYEYIGKAQNKKKIKLEFCYSKLINKINTKSFEKYNDFFINDFFKKSERPYLKYKMIVDDFILTFTAVKILNTDLKKLKVD